MKADSANNTDDTTHKILNDTDLAEVRDQIALLMCGNDIATQICMFMNYNFAQHTVYTFMFA